MSWTDTATVIGAVVLAGGLIASPAALLVFLTRRRCRAKVEDTAGGVVAGATVFGHATSRGSSVTYLGDIPVVERTSDPYRRRLGRTGADGVVETTLWLTNPWGVSAGADGYRPSDVMILPGDGRDPIDVVIRLTRESPG